MAIDYRASSELSRRALEQMGLSSGQAALYEALIHFGPQKATKLAFLAGVPRTLSYSYLEELMEQGLVTKQNEPEAVSIFIPVHPVRLKELAEARLESAQASKRLIEEALPGLVHDFDNLLGTLPESELYARVALYAGKAGLGLLSGSEQAALQKALEELLAGFTQNKA